MCMSVAFVQVCLLCLELQDAWRMMQKCGWIFLLGQSLIFLSRNCTLIYSCQFTPNGLCCYILLLGNLIWGKNKTWKKTCFLYSGLVDSVVQRLIVKCACWNLWSQLSLVNGDSRIFLYLTTSCFCGSTLFW